MVPSSHRSTVLSVLCVLAVVPLTYPAAEGVPPGLQPLKYSNPGLVVDLGVGLWAQPLPMDFDGDGDHDLVVASADKPYKGIYFFENTEGDVKFPVFRPAVRIGSAVHNMQVSHLAEGARVTTPGKWYPDFRKSALEKPEAIPYKKTFYTGRSNQWKLCDYDGDGVLDLIVGASDWREYGWDNAFNEKGEWTRGPIRGYVYFVRNAGTNDAPEYGEAVQVMAGDGLVDVYGMPSPNFADWDGDGDLDLLCGEFLDKLTYFQNVGTRTQPEYAHGKRLEHGGEVLAMDLQMILVSALDWDKDGDVDLVVGQEDGRVALLECTGKQTEGMPDFLPPHFFQQQADNVKFGALCTPVGVDWDGDGDEDLVCGNTAGYLGFVENLDGGTPPTWAPPTYLEADGKTIRIQAGPNGSIQGPAEAKWGYTVLDVADWDHDGLLDIVLNSIWGEVLWYRNVGTRTQPKLTAAQPVEVEWRGAAPQPAWNWWHPKGRQLVTQWRTSPVVIDLNGDRLNDLLMLDHEGYLAFFERRKQGDTLQLLPGKRAFTWEDGKPLRLNEREAGKSGRRKLTMVDWDRDGDLDLLVNSRNVDFLKNVSTDGGFVFRNLGLVDDRILAGHTTCPTTVDWDKNGVRDLVVGAEDGFLYYLPNPFRETTNPRRSAAQHLVAAWDFESGRGGPLADKASAGQSADALTALGAARAQDGIGFAPADDGAAFQAASSVDLEPDNELTIWIRFRVERNPTRYLSLVDKRHFRDPEERSYGLYLPPGPKTGETFAVGGQISADGTGATAAAISTAKETLPVGEWREVAMVVERAGAHLAVSWYASASEEATAPADLRLVAGPVMNRKVTSLFRSKQPLTIGKDINLKATPSAVEIDEVRLYDRALSLAELADIVPGELSN